MHHDVRISMNGIFFLVKMAAPTVVFILFSAWRTYASGPLPVYYSEPETVLEEPAAQTLTADKIDSGNGPVSRSPLAIDNQSYIRDYNESRRGELSPGQISQTVVIVNIPQKNFYRRRKSTGRCGADEGSFFFRTANRSSILLFVDGYRPNRFWDWACQYYHPFVEKHPYRPVRKVVPYRR